MALVLKTTKEWAESGARVSDMKPILDKELEWDTNFGYALPVFRVIVMDNGNVRLNCYDEYIVELSDEGLSELKDAIDLAYKFKKG